MQWRIYIRTILTPGNSRKFKQESLPTPQELKYNINIWMIEEPKGEIRTVRGNKATGWSELTIVKNKTKQTNK